MEQRLQELASKLKAMELVLRQKLRPLAKWINITFLLTNALLLAQFISVSLQLSDDLFEVPASAATDCEIIYSELRVQTFYMQIYHSYNACDTVEFVSLRPSLLAIVFLMVQPVVIRWLIPAEENLELDNRQDQLYPGHRLLESQEDRQILSNLLYSLYLLLFGAVMVVVYAANNKQEGHPLIGGYLLFQVGIPLTFYFALMFTRYPSRLWLIPLFLIYYNQFFTTLRT